MVMPTIPTIKEELERKTYEALEWLSHSVETGRISEAEFSTGADVVWKLTSGLVTTGPLVDAMKAATEIEDECDRTISRLYIADDGLTKGIRMVRWTPGRPNIQVMDNELNLTTHAYEPHEVKKRVDMLDKKLLEKGWTRL